MTYSFFLILHVISAAFLMGGVFIICLRTVGLWRLNENLFLLHGQLKFDLWDALTLSAWATQLISGFAVLGLKSFTGVNAIWIAQAVGVYGLLVMGWLISLYLKMQARRIIFLNANQLAVLKNRFGIAWYAISLYLIGCMLWVIFIMTAIQY